MPNALSVHALVLAMAATLAQAAEVPQDCRPWAYNWWLGSAVDKQNISRELERYRDGGLGGIHIIPIYGAKGAESRYISYLSPEWMEMLSFVVTEAHRIGLGVDMTTGSGWCFGGPSISREDGGWRLQTKTITVPANGTPAEKIDAKSAQAVIAVGPDGQRIDLKSQLKPDSSFTWEPKPNAWTIYALLASPGGPVVKRAAPGGAGPMLNPFSPVAMEKYLAPFTDAFATYTGPLPRAMYHDSYEYNSSWSPQLPAAFAKRRGYQLEDRVADFCGDPAKSEMAARVRCDYKETLSDLMIEEVFPKWFKWCRDRNILTRDQAHGSPANLLDLYAQADVPETEMFGRGTRDPLKSGFDEQFGEGDRSPLVSKFASSAAHVAGRKLVAAETGTWMAEHFCETLEEMKCLVDLLFVSGVNHVIYHGCCYSPDDAPWPGWLFYASTQMNPRNPIWRDVPALNQYIARSQAELRSGRPANDVLLYWPIHELWSSTPQLLNACGVHNRDWLNKQPIGKTAGMLWQRGYGFDYISDRQFQQAATVREPTDKPLPDGRGSLGVAGIAVPGGQYKVILVPASRMIPLATMQNLAALADGGATVLFEDRLPDDVPGAGDLENRRATMRKLIDSIKLEPLAADMKQARVGKGRILVGTAETILESAGVRREKLVDHPGARFIRRASDEGWTYFIANQGTRLMQGEFELAVPATAATLFDPMTAVSGVARMRSAGGSLFVQLRLEPGQSIIVRAYRERRIDAPAWVYRFTLPGDVVAKIAGPWQLKFIAGGPNLPKETQMVDLRSWTKLDDPAVESFAGTALYSTMFDAPKDKGPHILDLGDVRHSARIRLNGKELGVLLMKPYHIELPSLRPTGNVLEIEVTNLAANRIRDLDRRRIAWRNFHDANVVNINYKAFDASNWPVFDSGLIGPVMIRLAAPAGD